VKHRTVESGEIEYLLTKSGLSKGAFVRKIGVPEKMVYNWLKGEKKPSPLAVRRIQEFKY